MPAALIAIPIITSLMASHKASQDTKNASNAAIGQQDKALSTQDKLSKPYRELGESAIPTLQSLLGIGPPGGPNPTDTLRGTPGYQFARNEGLTGTTNAATAQGMSLSGNTLEALDKFGTGLADQTYQSAVGNLQNVAGIGQAAAAGQAANVGNVANNNSATLRNQGLINAGIDVNTIAALGKVAGTAMDQHNQQATLAGLTGGGNGDPGYSPNWGMPALPGDYGG